MIWIVQAQYSYYDDVGEARMVAYFDGQNAMLDAQTYAKECEMASVHRSFKRLNELDPEAKGLGRNERLHTDYMAYPCNLRNPLP